MSRRQSQPLPDSWPALIAWVVAAKQREWRRTVTVIVIIGLFVSAFVLIGHLTSAK